MEKFLLTSVPKRVIIFALFLQGFLPAFGAASFFDQDPVKGYIVYKGIIEDKDNDPIASAYLAVKGTNIATVTNSEGAFTLKVPEDSDAAIVNVSHLGFQAKNVPLEYFLQKDAVLTLVEVAQSLAEVKVYTATDPGRLVWQMLKNKGENYSEEERKMNAFYRETIRRGRRNVSLSEAIVTIHKEPYTSLAKDNISLIKARKSADYERLDTLALKLQGGPFNNLYMDLMKNTDLMFEDNELSKFRFSFDEPTQIDDRYLYVVNFEEKNQGDPWFAGQFFIDAETATLVKASFELNVDDRKEAARMFVKRKPGGTKVYPIEVIYDIEYRERDGKWYYGYGKSSLQFVVNWKRKLFNRRYTVESELAVTNWQVPGLSETSSKTHFIEPDIVMADDVSGFADTAFWGANNIIEPDKSIENAIEKIQRRMEEN